MKNQCKSCGAYFGLEDAIYCNHCKYEYGYGIFNNPIQLKNMGFEDGVIGGRQQYTCMNDLINLEEDYIELDSLPVEQELIIDNNGRLII